MATNKNPNLSNSIYQQKGGKLDLSIKDGMLINNKPDGTTGIAHIVQGNRMKKRFDAIDIQVDASIQADVLKDFREINRLKK